MGTGGSAPTYRTQRVYPTPPRISGGRTPRTGRGAAVSSSLEPSPSGLLAGLLHVDRADAVVELGEVAVDLGVAAVRVVGDRPGPAVLLVEAGHQLGHGDVAERRVLLEQVPELAGEPGDATGLPRAMPRSRSDSFIDRESASHRVVAAPDVGRVLAPEVRVGRLLVVARRTSRADRGSAGESWSTSAQLPGSGCFGVRHVATVPGWHDSEPSDVGAVRSRRSACELHRHRRRRAARRCTTTARGRGASAGSGRCGGSGRPAGARRRPRRRARRAAAPR